MENIVYTINLVIHNLAAVARAAAPFYQLRMVNERGKHGRAIIYGYDQSIERILSVQPRLCFAFIVVLIVTGFAFPVIYYAFHGHWREASSLALAAFTVKTLLVFGGFGIVLYGLYAIDPKIQALFAQSHYAVVHLGASGGTNSQAFCVNAGGAIVGTADTTNGLPHAFLNSGCSTAPTCRARPTPR